MQDNNIFQMSQPEPKWKDQLGNVRNQKPDDFRLFYVPIFVFTGHLPAELLHKKILQDMQFLKDYAPEVLAQVVGMIGEQYESMFPADPAEIIPIANFRRKGGARP